jgi:hypothetical protein
VGPLNPTMQIIRNPKNGDELDARGTMYPCRLEVFEGERKGGAPTSTSYLYVVSGQARVRAPHFEVRTDAGAFASVPGEFDLDTTGTVVVIERYGFRGLLSAGRTEDLGRLSYIDGCSDSVLCLPPRLGDPVLNFLHFPRGIVQTQHSHPSVRLGVVSWGEGLAFGPSGASGRWEEPLSPGCVFLLHAHEIHSFATTTGGDGMNVIAFHPDSDWGPTDAAHPMANRTYLSTQGAKLAR